MTEKNLKKDEKSGNGSEPEFKRRKTLILPKLQLSLVKAALVLFIAAAVIFYATINIVFKRLEEIAIAAGLDQNHPFFAELSSLENVTATVYGITVLLSIITIYVGGLRLSHRIAGPIYVLNRHIERICRGETSEDLKFRKDDFMLDVKDNFNKLMKKYRELLAKSGG
jgi:hypothetical protein